VGFALKDGKYFDGSYAQNDVLMPTAFTKGEPARYDFVKSGGWSADDENADFYEAFFADPELILPAGEYEVSATLKYSTDPDDVLGTQQTLMVSLEITVE
jgi:hypothetical protein